MAAGFFAYQLYFVPTEPVLNQQDVTLNTENSMDDTTPISRNPVSSLLNSQDWKQTESGAGLKFEYPSGWHVIQDYTSPEWRDETGEIGGSTIAWIEISEQPIMRIEGDPIPLSIYLTFDSYLKDPTGFIEQQQKHNPAYYTNITTETLASSLGDVHFSRAVLSEGYGEGLVNEQYVIVFHPPAPDSEWIVPSGPIVIKGSTVHPNSDEFDAKKSEILRHIMLSIRE